MTNITSDHMDQDMNTTTTTRKRRAACDNDNNDSNNTSTSTLSNTTTPNATNNETTHQPFKRPRLPSPFTRQAEHLEEALNKEIQEQEDALRMNEYRRLAVRALDNEAHDRAFRDAMELGSTYQQQQQQQQYTSPHPPPPASATATVDEDMDLDMDDYNPQHEGHEGNGRDREMVAPTVADAEEEGDTQLATTTRSGCLTSIIGTNNINHITRPRTNNNNNSHNNLNGFIIYEDLETDPAGLLRSGYTQLSLGLLQPEYYHYHHHNHNNNNQEVRAYQDWDEDKENHNNVLHDDPDGEEGRRRRRIPFEMLTETEAESFSQVVDSYHSNAEADADAATYANAVDDDEMRMDDEEGGGAAGGDSESGRWSFGVPPWRVESESEYADTEVDPDEAGLGLQDYSHRRRRRYHRLRWQSRLMASEERGGLSATQAAVDSGLVPRALGEGSLLDGGGGVAGRGRRGSRRL
ncbi:hypothetical protein ASPBRDRAFT_654288 [Aspergillus brasiliensis CBS 101740]|uniref:Uncharacterized protein n=1 Tax=Aspergillus brasiliensis (strain CBS 101740 / IMI 381727 / IBT 21946) TaxID=767769 RepID=A0A1L9UZM6_ASPBC|nr:hypothetical protein ASPBRDRAFT_654288 [Aspergillus brasiliensis CBS 101740]